MVAVELAAAILWPAAEQEEFDPSGDFGAGEGPPLRVAALGDSTLTAPGVSSAEEIWVSLVARRLATHLNRRVELRSFGTGGATSAVVAAHQLPQAIEFRPHLALVSVGANDVIRGVPRRKLEANLDRIVSELSATGTMVVTSGVGDLGTIPRLAPPLRQMVSRMGAGANRLHSDVVARHGAAAARQWDWAAGEFASRADVWSLDRFHPNAAGHDIWARVCWEALEPLMEDLSVVDN